MDKAVKFFFYDTGHNQKKLVRRLGKIADITISMILLALAI